MVASQKISHQLMMREQKFHIFGSLRFHHRGIYSSLIHLDTPQQEEFIGLRLNHRGLIQGESEPLHCNDC